MKITRSSTIQSLVLAITLISSLGFFSPSVAAASWIMNSNGEGLRSLGPGPLVATGIKDAGQVVGFAKTETDGGLAFHAFITGLNGVGVTYLYSVENRNSTATAINATGRIVGSDYFTASAFMTGPNGVGMTDLGTLPLGISYTSYAFGINAAGQVVGWSNIDYSFGFNPHAFITGPNGVHMTDLGTLSGGDGGSSFATGINDTAQVVGYSTTATGSTHAFITGPNGVGMTDLGTLGGTDSFAAGINNVGQVVGYSSDSGGNLHAFITGPNGVGMTEINTPGGSDSQANVVLHSVWNLSDCWHERLSAVYRWPWRSR